MTRFRVQGARFRVQGARLRVINRILTGLELVGGSSEWVAREKHKLIPATSWFLG